MSVPLDRAVTAASDARASLPPKLSILSALVDQVPAALFVKDMGPGCAGGDAGFGRYVLINRAGERLFGRPRDDIVGRTDLDLFDSARAERFRITDRAAIRSGVEQVFDETVVLAEEGRERRLRTRKLPYADQDLGLARYILALSEDVTDRLSDLETLREQNRRFDAAIEGMSHGLCMVDGDERMIVCNEIYMTMFGLDPAVIRPGVPFIDILRHSIEVGTAVQSLEKLYAVRKEAIAMGQATTYHEALSDGRLIAISHRPMPIPDDRSRAPHGHGGWVSIYEDVTRQRRAETALQEQNRRFDAALGNMGQGLAMFDAEGRILVYNDRLIELLGLPNGAVRVGQTHREIVEMIAARGLWAEGVDVEAIVAGRALRATEGETFPSAPILRYMADDRILAVLHRPMVGGGWVSTFEDVTERRRSDAQIVHMARHDALTNLPNRTTFQERVDSVMGAAGRGGIAAVFYIDLDAFKTVNDTFGHIAGDELLRMVAKRLRACVRDNDVVARLGGDEFAILQADMRATGDARALADRLLRAVEEPLHLDGHRTHPRISIGVAVAPVDGTQADQLMKRADLALYRAKADGGHACRFFEPSMEAVLQSRRQLEGDLHDALEAGAFEVMYQPLVDAQTEEVAGFEALVRWTHPSRGPIPPAEFIPIAEQTGLIVPLGYWILDRACADAASWPRSLPVAVNLSAAQFRDPLLVPKVAAILRDKGLEPSRLEIEITESVLLRDEPATLAALHALQAMGVRIAMDEFGTGYSSLSYLRSFPYDRIKVDRSFVQELGIKPEAEAIIRAIATLATSLGMEITAEGVETVMQFDTLKAQGCTQVQGFLFSRPRPAGDIAGMIAGRRMRDRMRAVA